MKGKNTFIDIPKYQPALDFDEAEHYPSFVFPEYQREIVTSRLFAGLADCAIIGAVFLIFLGVTFFQMPDDFSFEKRITGIYGVGFLMFMAVYFLLFMLSCSQTPGMKLRKLTVVTRDGAPLNPPTACLRGLGYVISILPLMLGFLWVVLDPEHLSWADKVSGTYVRKL